MALGRRSSGHAKRGLISGVETEPAWSRTGYGEAMRLTQGSPPDLASRAAEDVRKPTRQGEPETGRDQRVADSRVVLKTQGRRSAGNSVEEKTLTTKKGRLLEEAFGREPAA